MIRILFSNGEILQGCIDSKLGDRVRKTKALSGDKIPPIVEVDGLELGRILTKFTNIPLPGMYSAIWRDPWATFIIDNFPIDF